MSRSNVGLPSPVPVAPWEKLWKSVKALSTLREWFLSVIWGLGSCQPSLSRAIASTSGKPSDSHSSASVLMVADVLAGL